MPGGYLEEPAGFQGSGNPAGDPVQLPGVWGLQDSRLNYLSLGFDALEWSRFGPDH